MDKNELNELIRVTNKADIEIAQLKHENRIRMCTAIVEIVKAHGGKITAEDLESVFDEPLEIRYINEDGTYINDYCKVNSIETFEMHNGKLNFTVDCDESSDYAEWHMSDANVTDIYYALVDYNA